MSAHSVSPPTAGTSMARSTEPSDGLLAPGDVAVPDVLVAGGVGALLEAHDLGRARRAGRRSRSLTNGCASSGPQSLAEGVVLLASVRCWSRKNSTFHSSSARLSSANVLVVERLGERHAVDLGADGRAATGVSVKRVYGLVDPAVGRARRDAGPLRGRRGGGGRRSVGGGHRVSDRVMVGRCGEDGGRRWR